MVVTGDRYGHGSPVSLTYRVYRDAVRVLTLFYDTVWEELSVISDKKRRFNHAEHLVHGTKKNICSNSC